MDKEQSLKFHSLMNNTILKTETQDLHDRIEHVMHSQLLFSNQFTVAHYQNFILRSYRYISNIIEKVSLEWPEFKEILTQKQEALLADLAHLHISPADSSSLVVTSANRHNKLGLIYIVLGAMLGNKMILKKLQDYTEFEDFPFTYLSKHQDQLATIWKNFQSQISALTPEELQNVIQGARDGYFLFGE